jgi:hypothetical protein
MFDGENHDGIATIMEPDSVSTDAQAKLGRFDVLKALYIAFPGVNEARQTVENSHRGWLIDGPDIGLCLIGPDDPIGHRYRFVPFGSVGGGVRPIRSKSSMVSPNSASTSS